MEGWFEQLMDDVRIVQVYMYVYYYTGRMYMNIIKHFVWMYGLMDGWMDRSVKGTSQGFSFCGAARNMAPHTGRLHCQYLYIIPPTPLPFAADGTISLFCTTTILPPYLSYEVALNQMGYRLS